MTAVNKGNQEE